jgi:flavorubredoxin
MPVEVSAKIPQIKSHSFLVKDDKVVIIDPKDNKVAALIE